MWQYGSLHHGMIDSKGVSADNAERKISGSRKIRIAESYDEIYKYIKRSQGNEGIAMYARSGNETAAAADTGSGNETSAAAMTEDGGYSQTNVRQSGVDEGDIAKTDGTYLYVREDNGRTIDIIDAGKGQLEKYNEITLEKEYTIQEFYIDTDRKKLVAVCQKECTDADNKKQAGTAVRQQTKTAAVTYDISDIKKPVKEGEVTQSGTYNSSRMADGYLYLFSEYYTGSNVVKDKPVTYVPMVNDKAMSQSSICLPPENCGMMYEVISSVDISKPDETADHKAILSEGGQMYVSKKNIYYYESGWQQDNQTVTTLRKISYNKGKLKAAAQGKVLKKLVDGKAEKVHKHTKDQIENFPETMKNPKSLILNMGNEKKTYAGDSEVTVNITTEKIGAATKEELQKSLVFGTKQAAGGNTLEMIIPCTVGNYGGSSYYRTPNPFLWTVHGINKVNATSAVAMDVTEIISANYVSAKSGLKLDEETYTDGRLNLKITLSAMIDTMVIYYPQNLEGIKINVS